MERSKVTVLRSAMEQAHPAANSIVIPFETLKSWVLTGSIFKHLLRYAEARVLTYRLETMPKPFLTTLLVRLLTGGSCFIQDSQGRTEAVTPSTLGALLGQLIKDFITARGLVRGIESEVATLANMGPSERRRLDISGSPLYLRTDLTFGLQSGGSVGHIAGVLNALGCFTAAPIFLSSDSIPTVRSDIKTHLIMPKSGYWDFLEVPSLKYNLDFQHDVYGLLDGTPEPAFVYQRYSLNNYCGLKLARRFQVPLVLEYNGSEVWINRHWGKPLKYEALSERIELLNLRSADLIVVVSAPMKEELLARGIAPQRILVNPNGVDAEVYFPERDGSSVRNKLNLADKLVIGFIGTFGPWHGAEVLAEAFGRLLTAFPQYRGRLRLMMIGDGSMMPQVRAALARFQATGETLLTGIIPQQDGPAYLAACDILVSPHVPNPDGTPFFGSPTKLFEYMAMGRAIVASNLDQIGEVLTHNHSAWMVAPGDANSLMAGMLVLVQDEAMRVRLGENARRDVVAKFTWLEHTRKILDGLKECYE